MSETKEDKFEYEDWAVIVGIQVYPGFDGEMKPLQGPENDAIAFAQWVCSPSGGRISADSYVQQYFDPEDPAKPATPFPGVSKGVFGTGRVALILSSHFTPPVFEEVAHGKPEADQIIKAFDELKDLSDKAFRETGYRKIGRRLYLFFAGHGLQPGKERRENEQKENVALFMANAAKDRTQKHFLAPAWVNWLYSAGVFDEVVLFMDCCRQLDLGASPRLCEYDEIHGSSEDQKGVERRRVFGLGAMPRRNSYEKEMADGKVHGLFSWALLKALSGAASPPGKRGAINALDLQKWMNAHIKTFLNSAEANDHSIPRDCRFYFPNEEDKNLVLVPESTNEPEWPVRIQLLPRRGMRTVHVNFGAYEALHEFKGMQQLAVEIRLPIGRYSACVVEESLVKEFNVTGVGVADVTL